MSVAVMCRAALKLPKQNSIFSGRAGAEALVEPGERAFCLREPIGSRQETAFVREFSRQIFVDDVIEAPLGQRLLLGANAHFQQLVDGGDPCGMRLDEGVAPARVPPRLASVAVSGCVASSRRKSIISCGVTPRKRARARIGSD